jgi:hypothetical protein
MDSEAELFLELIAILSNLAIFSANSVCNLLTKTTSTSVLMTKNAKKLIKK